MEILGQIWNYLGQAWKFIGMLVQGSMLFFIYVWPVMIIIAFFRCFSQKD